MFYDDDAYFRQRLKCPNTQRSKLPSFDIIENLPKRVLHLQTYKRISSLFLFVLYDEQLIEIMFYAMCLISISCTIFVVIV